MAGWPYRDGVPGKILVIIVLLAGVSFAIGMARDSWFARRIGEAARPHPTLPQQTLPPRLTEDPVVLLEKLQRLREAGALTEAEFDAQKARILGG